MALGSTAVLISLVAGLPTGQHVHLQTEVNGKKLVRVYTPVSSDDDKGIMDVVIKVLLVK